MPFPQCDPVPRAMGSVTLPWPHICPLCHQEGRAEGWQEGVGRGRAQTRVTVELGGGVGSGHCQGQAAGCPQVLIPPTF